MHEAGGWDGLSLFRTRLQESVLDQPIEEPASSISVPEFSWVPQSDKVPHASQRNTVT